jgi:LPXTG-site transpeptidase (sortase) family protein
MIRRPHFDTRTDDASTFRGKIGSVLLVVLGALLAIVVVSQYFDLPAHASSAYARLVGGGQPPPYLAGFSEPIEKSKMHPDQTQHKGFAISKQAAGGPRGEVGESAATIYRGKLTLSVPRLGLRDVPVPSGSSQEELNNQGIMRLESSGVPWSKGSNTSIIGHRIGFPRTKIPYAFYKLDELRPRDKIIVEDSVGKKYVYEVYDRMTGPPSNYWATHPVNGKTVISLQTCSPIPTYVDRLIVRGKLVSVAAA